MHTYRAYIRTTRACIYIYVYTSVCKHIVYACMHVLRPLDYGNLVLRSARPFIDVCFGTWQLLQLQSLVFGPRNLNMEASSGGQEA